MFAAAVILPFPLDCIPKVSWLAEQYEKLWSWGVESMTDAPADVTGSGDRTVDWIRLALILIVAAVGTGVWSVVDRKRTDYRRLARWLWIALRYWLSFALVTYGLFKFIDKQFPPPTPFRLDQRVGTMSPMGILWTLMGASSSYAAFGGVGELLGGVLLLWRRTATLGAIVAIGVMANVVALNFCFDVPVKLYSSELLLAAIAIASPAAPRLIRALLGRATEEVPPEPRPPVRWYRAGRAFKVGILLCAAYTLYDQHTQPNPYDEPPSELEGLWVVDTFALDGVEHPPLTTDAARLDRIAFVGTYLGTRTMTVVRTRYKTVVDEKGKTIAVTRLADDGTEKPAGTWKYVHAGDALTLEGTLEGKPFKATAKQPPPSLLMTRGFHWINEVPFNR